MNFLKNKLTKFWMLIKPLSEREVVEKYLSDSTDLADLERRMRRVYNTGL
jgi:hypothetical protein